MFPYKELSVQVFQLFLSSIAYSTALPIRALI